jgi:hypothetical protein
MSDRHIQAAAEALIDDDQWLRIYPLGPDYHLDIDRAALLAVRAWLASVGLTSDALTTWDKVFRDAGYGHRHRPSEITGWAEAVRGVEQL